MNHKITLMRQQTGKDAAGQPVETWADVATIWSDVRFQSGAEVLRAGSEVAIKRATIRIRSRTDVDASWRVRYKGEVFDVKSALPADDRAFMFMVVEAVK